MAEPIIQPSLSAGELSPLLFARVDLAKYHVGVALMRNMFVDYRGGSSNRPGTAIVGWTRVNTKVRLIPFQFSTVQAYMLEFGSFYIRVIMNGGYVLEPVITISGITQASPGVVTTATPHGFATSDDVYITAVGMVQITGRVFRIIVLSATTFSLVDMFGVAVNTSAYSAFISGTVARVYTIVTPYTAADIPTLKFTQSADVITITHQNYASADLTRTGHAIWTYTAISFTETITAPATVAGASSAAGTSAYRYAVTSVAPTGEESLQSSNIVFTNVLDLTTTPHGNLQVSWSANPAAEYYNIYAANHALAGGATPPPLGSILGYIGYSYGLSFTDSGIVPDFTKSPPYHRDPFAQAAIQRITITAPGAGYTNPTTVAITDASGVGASADVILSGGTVIGVIINNQGSGYVAPTFTFTGGPGAGATATATLSPAIGTFPGAVSYFQQRKCFGGSFNDPQAIWMTKTGLFKSMNVSNPVRADDAITMRLTSQQVNNIKFMVAMPGGLIVLTGYGVWQISGGGQNNSITPSNIVAQAQSYNGCSDIPPVVIGANVLYVQAKGSIVRDLTYNFNANVYVGNDITVLSSHLITMYSITEWAYAEEPYKIIWSVRADGKLLSLTYMKEQEILGWAQHDTDGLFTSICSVSEGNEIAVYFVVTRVIQGINIQYVERLASRQINGDIIQGWFLDSAIRYSGAPVTSLRGLEHLEGRVVTALIDGVAYPNITVTGHSITLPVAGSIVLVGLPYTAQLQTMPLDLGSGPTIQGKRKKVASLGIRVYQTRSMKYGPEFGATLVASKVTTTVPAGPVPQGTWANGLFTGDDRNIITQLFTVHGQICLQQDNPYPLTVLGIIPEVVAGDIVK